MPSPDVPQDIFALTEKLSQFKNNQDTVVTRLTTVSSDISRQLKDVRSELAQFARDKDNVQNMAFKIEVLEAEVGKLRTKLDQSDESIETTLKDEGTVRAKVSDLIGKVVELDNRVGEAESTFLSRAAQLESLSSEFTRSSQALARLQELGDRSEKGHETHRARLDKAAAIITELDAKVGRLATASDAGARELSLVKKSLAGFSEDIARIDGNLAEIGSRLTAAASERSALKRELGSQRSRLDGVEENVSTAFLVKDELERTKRDVAEQQGRINDLEKVGTQIIARFAEEEDVVKGVLEKEARRRMSSLEKELGTMVDGRIRSFTSRLDEEAKAVEARAATLEEWSKRMAAKEREMDSALARLGVVSEADFSSLKARVDGITASLLKVEKLQDQELKIHRDAQERDHERLKKLEVKLDKSIEVSKGLSEQIGRLNDKLDLLQF